MTYSDVDTDFSLTVVKKREPLSPTVLNRTTSGLSLKFQDVGYMIQVGGESNSLGFCSVLFFFYFPTKVVGDHVHNCRGKSPAPSPDYILVDGYVTADKW